MFSVERSELARVVRRKAAGSSILWIVEPESYMASVGWRQCCVRIESEDLVEQDGLDTNVAVVSLLADLAVRLIPRQTASALDDGFEVRTRRLITCTPAAFATNK